MLAKSATSSASTSHAAGSAVSSSLQSGLTSPSESSSISADFDITPLSSTSSPPSPPHAMPTLRTGLNTESLADVISANRAVLSATCEVTLLQQIVDDLAAEMAASLADMESPSMLISGVGCLPTGNEHGSVLAVDLGGSSLKIACVVLPGGASKSEHHEVPKHIKTASGAVFFAWIADKIANAVMANNLQMPVDIGISWSFPLRHTPGIIEDGIVDGMGKGYTVINEIKGWSLKTALEEALLARQVRATIRGVVNDAISTLLAHCYQNPDTRLGLILGTGINCCAQLPFKNTLTIVNTELSMLGKRIPETCWDKEIDEQVEIPGYQPMETKVSGRYLGEISRLIIRDMTKAGMLCNGSLPEGLGSPYALQSATVAALEELYHSGNIEEAHSFFQAVHPCPAMTMSDIQQILWVISSVSDRAAAITACGLHALASLRDPESKEIVVGCTGTVIEKYPGFYQTCQKYVDVIGSPRGNKLKLEVAGEGSFIGPAVACLM